MTVFTIRLADLVVEMHCRYAATKQFCGDYCCETAPPDIIAETTDAEIERQRMESSEPVSLPHAESVCLYRSIAEQLPRFNGFVFHGAAISYRKKGYLFTAPSGTGKTTHITLWRALLGDAVDIINGDKPIVRLTDNGPVLYASPWAGKEGWQKNTSAPLAAVCVLSQAKDCTVTALKPFENLPLLLRQLYLPQSPEAARQTLVLLERLCGDLRLFSLQCNISKNAVRVSFEALTGEPFSREGL